MKSIVLAGERPNAKGLGSAFDVPAGVLVRVAGEACLVRVLRCLNACANVEGGVICGSQDVLGASVQQIQAELTSPYTWIAPASGPAASVIAALDSCAQFPLLLTTGDHALLRPETVDQFCGEALKLASDGDLVVGLVPYALVQSEFPETRRTVLQFADGAYCGSNLFMVMNSGAKRGLDFWRGVEAERKRPWKIASHLGWLTLLRYLVGRLSVTQAMQRLSKISGCRVRWVAVHDARAAIDVDTMADWKLADQLLQQETNVPSS